MNLNFLCCIGAEQKHDQSGLLKMNQVYFYRAYADETMSEILEDNFFNHSESHLKENDIILAYSPNEQDLPKVRWLRIVIPHAGLVKTEKVDNSYLLEVLREDLGDLGDQVQGIEEKIPENTSPQNPLATKSDITNKITNCITEIPQDIKLEIVDGAVVLKAGSKGYRPNGAGVFNQITASTDISKTISTDGVYMVVSWGLSSLDLVNINSCFSGDTQPVNPPRISVWYNTTNNVIKQTYDNGSTWSGTLLFPLGIVTVSNGGISSIDQVFNGFGYIGSCVFTLPGVKGLYPNGRNKDGTLKNGLINCTDVQVSSNFNDTVEHTLMINPNGRCAWYSTTGWYYNDIANVMVASTGTVLKSAALGTFETTNGAISNFNPYEAFHAVDYSDFENTVAELNSYILSTKTELTNSISSTKTELNNSILSTKTELNSSISSVDSSAVHKTGNETIAGIKTFEASPIVPTPAANSNSTNAATTAWVRTHTSNVVRLVAEQKATSANNYTWYRKYSDGWVEQGGIHHRGSAGDTVNLSIAMSNEYYELQLTAVNPTGINRYAYANSYTSTYFKCGTADDQSPNNDGDIRWYVCGYAAS